MTTKLSDHFTLEELTHSDTAVKHGIANTPTAAHLANAKNWLVPVAEQVRTVINGPMNVYDAYRNPEVNHIVGGTPTSAHPMFLALDFDSPGQSPLKTAQTIAIAMKPGGPLHGKIDQLILERAPGRVVHVSADPRGAKPGQPSRARGMRGYQPGGPNTPIDWHFFDKL